MKVIIADDHQIMARALAALLDSSFEITATVYDGRALVAEVMRCQPDLVVSDIFMPLLNGIDALRQIRSRGKQTKVIFLTMHMDVGLACEAFQAGASGFVSKASAEEELLFAIREAQENRPFVTPLLGKDILSILNESVSKTSASDFGPSPRQREVLQLLAEGKTLKEVGAILGISPRTVETHKYEMMEALGAKTTSELILWALRLKLIPLEEQPRG